MERTTRIYLLTPSNFEIRDFAKQFPAVLEAGDVGCVQLRLKDAPDDLWRHAVKELMPLCHAKNIPLILNDRADLVKELNADGVHIGREDMSYEEARKLLSDKIIGVSCYASKDLAMEAAATGADYVAFGSAFVGGTKAFAPTVPLSVMEEWAEMATTPCVAIGGITAENCAPLVKARIDFLAVIGTVWNDPQGPVAGISKLRKAIDAAQS
jgi:thiamine-phosphate pyrophosphorylase